jgi:hypothetical protein
MPIAINRTSIVRPEGHGPLGGASSICLTLCSALIVMGTAIAASRGKITYNGTYAAAGLTVLFTAGAVHCFRGVRYRAHHQVHEHRARMLSERTKENQPVTIKALINTLTDRHPTVIHYTPEGQMVVEPAGDGDKTVTEWGPFTDEINAAVGNRQAVYIRSAETPCYLLKAGAGSTGITAEWCDRTDNHTFLRGDNKSFIVLIV